MDQNNLIEESVKYLDYLTEQINSLKAIASSNDNLVDMLLSNTGKWILNPKIPHFKEENKKQLVKSLFYKINEDLSRKNYHINKISQIDNHIYLTVENEEQEKILDWFLFEEKINVYSFNRYFEQQKKYDEQQKKYDDKKAELNETKLILTDNDALINHGFYIAYLKKQIPFTKFKKESKELMNILNKELKDEEMLLISNKESLSQKEMETNSTRALLLVMQNLYSSFPYGINLDNYNDYKFEYEVIHSEQE